MKIQNFDEFINEKSLEQFFPDLKIKKDLLKDSIIKKYENLLNSLEEEHLNLIKQVEELKDESSKKTMLGLANKMYNDNVKNIKSTISSINDDFDKLK